MAINNVRTLLALRLAAIREAEADQVSRPDAAPDGQLRMAPLYILLSCARSENLTFFGRIALSTRSMRRVVSAWSNTDAPVSC